MSKSDQVETLFEKISELYKDEKVPSIIVNCAGIFILSKLIDTTEETFDKIVNVNLKGPFLITRAAIKELVKHFPGAKLKPLESYASVINISSISAKSGFPGNQCVYAATKSGLDAMSTILGFELAEYQIRVNSVAPGPIRSPMNTANPQSKLHADMTYMKRLGEASEIAECCLFLASDRSSYITGYCLDCGGGWY